MPFHKGHEAMINFALTKSTSLTILICCSDKELLAPAIRKKWLIDTFKDTKNLDIQTFDYLENEFPNTSVSSKEVSAIWAKKFKELFPDYSLVVTSEPYGEYIATFMNIEHLAFDIERTIIPISASSIRKNSSVNWDYLPDRVKEFYIKKVVLLGSESTGKTTLANDLSIHFNASLVLEAGREVIKNSNTFTLEELYTTAIEHTKKIKKAIEGHSPLLIIDTDVHITQSYAAYTFGEKLLLSEETYALNKADLYLYLNNDVPFVQDGTRLNEAERNLVDLSHRKICKEFGLEIHEIKGNWEERFEKAVALIEKILLKQNNNFKM